ncbi:hypothetical protein MTO96_009995 [Rhipicephalus appendiculatus]
MQSPSARVPIQTRGLTSLKAGRKQLQPLPLPRRPLGGSTKVASTTASPFDSNEALADAGYVAGTTSPNEVEAPVRKPLTDDEPVNSVEDALQGDGRDSIMFVSSTPVPLQLHHSFDLQDLNTVSGGKPCKT